MSSGGTAPLSGERVLIVEERYLIAMEVAEEVARLGGRVIGPSRTIQAAQQLLADGSVDLALLDVSLDPGDVFPLATELDSAGVPIIFVTGYDAEVLPARWRDRPRLTKPVNPRLLREELEKLRLAARRGGAN